MDLTGEQADQIGSALLARLPAVKRARVRDRVGGLLRQGKVPAALAVVGPMLFQGNEAALTDLRRRLAGDQLDLGAPLARAHESAGVGLLHALHALGRWGTVTLGALLAATAVLSVLLAAQHARCGRGDTMLLVAGGMVIGGATALLLGLLLPTLVGDPTAGIISANPTLPLPLRVRNLLHDLQGTMIDRIRTEWEQVAAGVVLAGCLLGLVGLLVQRRRWPLRRRRSVALALSAALLLSSSWLVTPAHFGGEAASCNSSRALCALRYDKAVYAASHNAMASSADDFVEATQDPDLVGQLDTGVRALLLDVQHWTTPMQVETFLARLRPRERDALEPLVRDARSTRPGLWLCHSVCQLGSLSLDTALHSIDEWLARNPSEVVTLILQDSVPPGEVIAAVRRAGLLHRIVTPPADPHGRWGTWWRPTADWWSSPRTRTSRRAGTGGSSGMGRTRRSTCPPRRGSPAGWGAARAPRRCCLSSTGWTGTIRAGPTPTRSTGNPFYSPTCAAVNRPGSPRRSSRPTSPRSAIWSRRWRR